MNKAAIFNSEKFFTETSDLKWRIDQPATPSHSTPYVTFANSTWGVDNSPTLS